MEPVRSAAIISACIVDDVPVCVATPVTEREEKLFEPVHTLVAPSLEGISKFIC